MNSTEKDGNGIILKKLFIYGSLDMRASDIKLTRTTMYLETQCQHVQETINKIDSKVLLINQSIK